MPPIKNDDTPSLLKPFIFQGMVFDGKSGEEQVTGRCPFCDREGKFYVNQNTGQWACQVCAEKGNIKTFLKRLWEESRKQKCDYKELARDRKILYPSTLEEWGLCRSMITNEWMIPGYSIDGVTGKPKFCQLYLWKPDVVTKKNRFIAPGWTNSDDGVKTTHGLFCSKWDTKKLEIHLIEGVWDAAVYSETISRTLREEGKYRQIGEESASLYADVNILATPGANVFQESWSQAFSGKKVTILYDNDHPREHPKTKAITLGAGFLGSKRVTEVLSSYSEKPESVHYLNWGVDGYDPTLPTRYDIRDHLSKGKTDRERVGLLGELLDRVTPIDPSWISSNGHANGKKGSVAAAPIKCVSWKELREQWTKAMSWHDGLDHALPAMIACAASVFLPEDLIWLKVISPPSTGKTDLAEALALDTEGVLLVSTFTGLHSGMRGEDGEDNSLISLLGGKCFIIKEGDTLLRLANRETVWAELRDAYDKNTRTHFKNGVSNEYLDWPFSHILCGTGSLHEMDSSELGQRYLDIVIMDKIDNKLERGIGKHKISSIFDSLDEEPEEEEKGSISRDKMRARQMTAGYLRYIVPQFRKLITKVKKDRKLIETFSDYAQFIAYFRARPSTTQNEEVSRELSARLCSQITKLGCGIAAVLNKESLDAEVMNRVRRVAIDTARGKTANIAKLLYHAQDQEMTSRHLANSVIQGEMETKSLLQFLQQIDAVEVFMKEGKIGSGTAMKWRLTDTVRELYKRVMVDNAAGK